MRGRPVRLPLPLRERVGVRGNPVRHSRAPLRHSREGGNPPRRPPPSRPASAKLPSMALGKGVARARGNPPPRARDTPARKNHSPPCASTAPYSPSFTATACGPSARMGPTALGTRDSRLNIRASWSFSTTSVLRAKHLGQFGRLTANPMVHRVGGHERRGVDLLHDAQLDSGLDVAHEDVVRARRGNARGELGDDVQLHELRVAGVEGPRDRRPPQRNVLALHHVEAGKVDAALFQQPPMGFREVRAHDA